MNRHPPLRQSSPWNAAASAADQALTCAAHRPPARRGRGEDRGLCSGSWSLFWQAVLFRRATFNHSRRFQRAVAAVHAACLAALVVFVASRLWPVIAPASRERRIIEQWIADHHPGKIQIRRCESSQPAPDGQGIAVRVRMCYAEPGQSGVEANQWFVIEDGQVVRVGSEL